MTTNRTSLAATRWAIATQLGVPIRCSVEKAQELFAIVEKYKRMEEALQRIEASEHTMKDWCETGECRCLENIAHEALLHDPLPLPPST